MVFIIVTSKKEKNKLIHILKWLDRQNDVVYIILLHNVKVGKDTVDNDPEDDQGNTPYQKYQLPPEKKEKDEHLLKNWTPMRENCTCSLLSGMLDSLF